MCKKLDFKILSFYDIAYLFLYFWIINEKVSHTYVTTVITEYFKQNNILLRAKQVKMYLFFSESKKKE